MPVALRNALKKLAQAEIALADARVEFVNAATEMGNELDRLQKAMVAQEAQPVKVRLAFIKPDVTDVLRSTRAEASVCSHANENPAVCACANECYCQTRTCAWRWAPEVK